MKILPTFSIVLGVAFSSCGGSDKEEKSPPKLPASELPEAKPVEKTKVTVRATEATQQIARERLELMKKLTAELKPLREAAAALEKEAELKALFGEYNRLGQAAAADGINGRVLDTVTAHLAPDEWRDVRAEFQQYLLLVKQLGQPQREMLERCMAEGKPAPAAPSAPQQEHLDQIKNAVPPSPPGGRKLQTPTPVEPEP
jgi:hypothetical protein